MIVSDWSENSQGSEASAPSATAMNRGSRFITRLFKPAIRLWLNTQIEHATALDISLVGRDRQILGGYLPEATISAQEVVYKGLHLSAIDVVAKHIQTNGLRVMRGQAFQLLKPIPVEIHLTLSEADLSKSLSAPLLATAIDELLQQILTECADWMIEHDTDPKDSSVDAYHSESSKHEIPSIKLQSERLKLQSHVNVGDRRLSVQLDTGLRLHNPHTLMFDKPQLIVDGHPVEGRSLENLNQFSIDLGETTVIESLQIHPSALSCAGQILVLP